METLLLNLKTASTKIHKIFYTAVRDHVMDPELKMWVHQRKEGRIVFAD